MAGPEAEKRRAKYRKKAAEAVDKEAERAEREREKAEAEELEQVLFGATGDATEHLLGSELSHEAGSSISDLVRLEARQAEEGERDSLEGPERGDGQPGRSGQEGHPADLLQTREGEGKGTGASKGRRPVWIDEDDDSAVLNVARVNRLRKLRKVEGETAISGTEYVKRLRVQHAKLNRGTKWALLPKGKSGKASSRSGAWDDDEDERGGGADRLEGLGSGKEGLGEVVQGEGEEEDEEGRVGGGVLLQAEGLVVKSRKRLPQGVIETTRMRDANDEEPCKGAVQSVHFHSNAQLLLTASYDKTLRFFQIDGKANPKVQSVFLEDTPIRKAVFTNDGARVIAAGRRKWYYVFDLVAGKVERVNGVAGREERSLESFEVSPDNNVVAFLGNEGHVMLVSQQSRQWIGNLKINGSVRTAAFASNGYEIVTGGGDGEIYHWDLRTRRCFHKGRDEGCINSTSLAVSASSKLFAAGSDAGVVNLYDRQAYLGGAAAPTKTFMNLTTTIDTLKFSHDSQILAMGSRMKKDSMRLVHVPSQTVFSNWPTARSPLNYVHSLDFSPGGGYLALGNAKGKVLLYRLHHYDRA